MNTRAHARSIFLEATENVTASEWSAFLDERCGDDEDLRQHVQHLLDAHARDDSFMQRPAADCVTHDHLSSVKLGTKIGAYKLLQPLGEGGMGDVYMADQTEPVKRRVALKIIKPGMDSRQVIARFEAERQALAMMDHPYIAHVLDAGAADDGRPYFVMELVKGIPITEFCDTHHLVTRARLELLLAVCRGVQHAHQKGVIHRDLKPSNVLVAEFDHDVVPKIIDFGLAKALNHSLTERTMFTQFGQIVGTLDYMSPEQAKFNQLDIDTRSDVYSLGVLLYEILTGDTPFGKERLRSSAFEEVLRIIREEEPPTPSTRLSSSDALPALAASRNTEPRKLAGLVRGDLDWIVMKAIAKERSDRYQTADALAADIQRHLNDQPIEAQRPSVGRRVRRFVRRNKVPVALTLLALLACTLGLIAYAGTVRIEKQRRARKTAIPSIKKLLDDGRVVHAFGLAREVRRVLPDDPAFQELWNNLTVSATFDNSPSGATISVRDWDGDDDDWLTVGETPLLDVILPKGDLRFRYAMRGYVTREFQLAFPDFLQQGDLISMTKIGSVPDGMVLIDGTRDAIWHVYFQDRRTDLEDFLIDRYEVTNAQFQEFVDAGGYRVRQYWSDLKFVLNGATLSWQQAVEHFRDETGQDYGPATWQNGRFPEGQGDYPVSGVSWFEAAAFAKFVGKKLPTLPHWQRAADTDQPMHLTALSNFSGAGPAARGTYRGIGRFEVYDLAGNVNEWCWNSDFEGRRYLRGGAWNESSYRFTDVDVASPWTRKTTYGFRCAKYLSEVDPTPDSRKSWQRGPWSTSDRRRVQLDAILPWYQYNKRLAFDDEVVMGNLSSDKFLHKIVRINAAYANERFAIHFFLPRGQRDSDETIVWVGGFGDWLATRFGDADEIELDVISRLVQTGRIVVYPICKGTFERGNGTFPREDAYLLRDCLVAAAKDVARTVDYLHAQDFVDSDRLIFMGYSTGAVTSPRILVATPNFKAAVLVTGGYPPANTGPEHAVFDPYQFTPHVKTPVLMINGKGDSLVTPTSQEFFKDLGSSNSKYSQYVLLDSEHDPPPKEVVRITDQWLRKMFNKE